MSSSFTDTSALETLPNIDRGRFWHALGVRAAGAAVIATADDTQRAGFFALSATHLTQEPPTVLVTIGKSTTAGALVRRAGCFSINYLMQGQEALMNVFSGKGGLEGDRRFTTARWSTMRSGAPVLMDAAGNLDCVLVETMDRYDVVIAIGRIVDFAIHEDAVPLVFHMGKAKPLSS